MTIPIFSLEQLDAVYKIDKDWLFDKLLVMQNAQRSAGLLADQARGVQEYVHELGFQLTKKNPDSGLKNQGIILDMEICVDEIYYFCNESKV